MADAVTSQTILNNSTHVVMAFNNVSDGTGEAAVLKVDASTFHTGDLVIEEIWFCCCGMGVNILWDATADVSAIVIGGNGAASSATGYFDFRGVGGLANSAGAGKTSDINFTTIGHAVSDTYFIMLKMRKV